LLFASAAGCAGLGSPRPEPTEFVRGQFQRTLKGPVERAWSDVTAALEADRIGVASSDRSRGVIACRRVRHAGGRDLLRRLREIADVRTAERRGLRDVSEYNVEYTVFLNPSDNDTAIKIVSRIEAVDRSRVLVFGPGLYQIIPETLSLPSKGVVERELFRRIAGRLFAAEEMLYYVGDLGYE
jgi:hypothetical protein